MDLSKMTPKDKMMYEVKQECEEELVTHLKKGIIPTDFQDTLYFIKRMEYKRGKADGK